MTVFDTGAFRAASLAHWEAAAPAWWAEADALDAQSREVTERLVEAAGVAHDAQVLELACGPAAAGRLAATIATDGEVVCSDFSQEMLAIAQNRTRDLPNVRFRVIDAEAMNERDETFDVVLCRYGFMLFAEPARAAAECARILRPGGRLVVAVWGSPARNPWFSAITEAVRVELGAPVPSAQTPGPFRFSEADDLQAVLAAAKLRVRAVERVSGELRFGSVDEWWTTRTALAGPLAQVLTSLDERQRVAIRQRAQGAVTRWVRNDGSLSLPVLTLVASATRIG